jgi:hypothetical protein
VHPKLGPATPPWLPDTVSDSRMQQSLRLIRAPVRWSLLGLTLTSESFKASPLKWRSLLRLLRHQQPALHLLLLQHACECSIRCLVAGMCHLVRKALRCNEQERFVGARCEHCNGAVLLTRCHLICNRYWQLSVHLQLAVSDPAWHLVSVIDFPGTAKDL